MAASWPSVLSSSLLFSAFCAKRDPELVVLWPPKTGAAGAPKGVLALSSLPPPLAKMDFFSLEGEPKDEKPLEANPPNPDPEPEPKPEAVPAAGVEVDPNALGALLGVDGD